MTDQIKEPSHAEQEFVIALLECITAMDKILTNHYFEVQLSGAPRQGIRDASKALDSVVNYVADRHCPAPDPVTRLRAWTAYPNATKEQLEGTKDHD